MSKLPVSVCIIAKNEERYLEECLQNIAKNGMEIVLVDTGSTDRTKEIARKYTDKIFDFIWINDFSAARNYAASKATNNWILALDCDEYIRDFDAGKLRICMQQHIRHVGMLQIHNIKTQNGQKTYSPEQVPRFYNRNFFEYRFRIHEQITPKHQTNLAQVRLLTYPLPAIVEHYGYDLTKEEMIVKQNRNLELLRSSIGETPFDDYLYFQMGQSYYVIDEFEKSLACYEKCFELNDDMTKGYMNIAVTSYARALEHLQRYEEELLHLQKYVDFVKTSDFNYLLAYCYQNTGNLLEALLTFVKTTQLPDFEDLGERAYEVYVNIMKLHAMRGNKEGMEHFKKRLEEYGLAHGRKIVIS